MPKVSSNALVRKAYLGGQGGRKLLNRVKPRCARMALNWMGKLSGGNNQHSHLHFHLPIYGSSWALSLPFHHITSGWHHQGCLIGSKYIYILCLRNPSSCLWEQESSPIHTLKTFPPPIVCLSFQLQGHLSSKLVSNPCFIKWGGDQKVTVKGGLSGLWW